MWDADGGMLMWMVICGWLDVDADDGTRMWTMGYGYVWWDVDMNVKVYGGMLMRMVIYGYG